MYFTKKILEKLLISYLLPAIASICNWLPFVTVSLPITSAMVEPQNTTKQTPRHFY